MLTYPEVNEVLSLLPKTVELFHVDRNDSLDNEAKKIQKCIGYIHIIF
jgi:hypothetical protein